MGVFSRLISIFAGGSDEDRLKTAIEKAKRGKPDEALPIYNFLLEKTPEGDLRARILFNRALAYSAISDDGQAERDLQQLLGMKLAPENVQSAAREKLARVQKRMTKTHDRSKTCNGP